jgi:hypothetical protein
MLVDRTVVVCLCASALATGCSSLEPLDAPTVQAAAVGNVLGNDADVGMVASGGSLVFYVCGGPTTLDTWTHWFAGSLPSSGEFSLSDAGWKLTGEASASGGAGELTPPGGAPRAWSAQPFPQGTVAGLYGVVDQGGCRTGVVVSQPSSTAPITVQGAWCDGTGRLEQVTPILPVVLTEQGLGIEVELAAGPKHLYATPVTAQ